MRIALKAVALGTALLMAISAAEAFTPSSWGQVRGRLAWKFTIRKAGSIKWGGTFSGGALSVNDRMVTMDLGTQFNTTPSGQEVERSGTVLPYTTTRGTSRSARYGTIPENEYQATNQWIADVVNDIRGGGGDLVLRGKTVDPGDLGEFSLGDIDTTATTVKGSAKGIKKFAHMKGSHKVKFAGTLLTGPHAGKTFKGQAKFKYDNLPE